MEILAGIRAWARIVIMAVFLALTGGAMASTTNVYAIPHDLTAKIYRLAGNKELLFTFKRTITETNASVVSLREFWTTNGTLAAREVVRYVSNRFISYELNEPMRNARGRIFAGGGQSQLNFSYTESGTPTRTAEEALQPDTMIADMMGPFINAHWDELMRGDSVKFRFAVMNRQETIGFKFTKDSETTRYGQPVVRLKMSATSMVYAPFVDPLYFTIAKNGPHRVLDYSGETTPRIIIGGEWKDVQALTVFDWGK
jgi:hypothetical protein